MKIKVFALLAFLLALILPVDAAIGIRATSTGPNSTASTWTITLPTGTTTGDVTYVYIQYANQDCSYTPPAGWQTAPLQSGSLVAFYRNFQAGDTTTPTFTACTSGVFSQSVAVSYTGADVSTATSSLDTSNAMAIVNNAQYVGDNNPTPSIVTNFQNGLEVLVAGNAANSGLTFNTPSTFSARVSSASGPGIAVFDKAITTGGYMSPVTVTSTGANGGCRTGMHLAIKVSGASAASAASGVAFVGATMWQTAQGRGTVSVTMWGGHLNAQPGDLMVIFCFYCATTNNFPGGFTQSFSGHNQLILAKTVVTPENPTYAMLAGATSAVGTGQTSFNAVLMLFRPVGSTGSTPYPSIGATTAAGSDTTNPSTGIVAPSIVPGGTHDALILWYAEGTGSAETWTGPSGPLNLLSEHGGPNELFSFLDSPGNPTGTNTATGTLSTGVTQATGFSVDVTLASSKTGTFQAGGGAHSAIF